jgi:aminocarboxymuconate-semialdehyde decarboxylase
MSVDIHNHIIPNRVLELLANDPVYRVSIKDDVWHGGNIHDFPMVAAWSDPDAKLQELDGKQLDRAVLSAAPKPLYYYELELEPQELMARTTNLGAAEFCEGHDDRLRWMAHVPLAFPEVAAKVLADAAEQGAVGVEIGTTVNGRRIDEPAFDPFWEAVESLNLPVFMHPAYENPLPEYEPYSLGLAIGLPVESTVALERLICARTLDRYPNLTIIAALGGGCFPYLVGRLRHYATFTPGLQGTPSDPWSYVGQLKFDSHLHDAEALQYLIQKAGPENVLIGTDCSFQSATPEPMRELRDATDDEAAFKQVAEGNALELFWGKK